MGRVTAADLLERMAGGTEPGVRMVVPRLIVRASTRPAGPAANRV